MSIELNRRQVLAMGVGAAGCLMARPFSRLSSAAETPAMKPAPSVPVSIQRCESYEPKLVRARLDAAFDQIGGIRKLVNGKTVTIKINVTGGPGELKGLPGYRTYHIHPGVLAGTCAALHDAGAKNIVVVESQYSPDSPERVLGGGGWDIPMIKSAGGNTVSFEDTRNRGAFAQYSTLKVPWGGFAYPAFMVNQRYEKTDVFISLSKMKDHLAAGTTGSIKNLFGILPTSLYGGDAPNENTTHYRGPVLHNGARPVPDGVPREIKPANPITWKQRVPRVTADALGARPIDLAIIDGIETNRGGEGPWASTVEPLSPKLLLVGLNAVCTDAITVAAMGYDPAAPHYEFPYTGENHLLLLRSVGIGEIDPKKIEVRGLTLKDATFPFNPRRIPLDIPTAYQHRAPWPCAAMA